MVHLRNLTFCSEIEYWDVPVIHNFPADRSLRWNTRTSKKECSAHVPISREDSDSESEGSTAEDPCRSSKLQESTVIQN